MSHEEIEARLGYIQQELNPAEEGVLRAICFSTPTIYRFVNTILASPESTDQDLLSLYSLFENFGFPQNSARWRVFVPIFNRHTRLQDLLQNPDRTKELIPIRFEEVPRIAEDSMKDTAEMVFDLSTLEEVTPQEAPPFYEERFLPLAVDVDPLETERINISFEPLIDEEATQLTMPIDFQKVYLSSDVLDELGAVEPPVEKFDFPIEDDKNRLM